MNRFKALRMVIIAVLAMASACSVADSEVPGPHSVPSVITECAKEWFYRFQNGAIDRSQLDARVNNELTDEMISSESAALRAFGHTTGFLYLGDQRVQYAVGYNFEIIFPKGRIIEEIAFDADGKIAGIDFQTFVLK